MGEKNLLKSGAMIDLPGFKSPKLSGKDDGKGKIELHNAQAGPHVNVVNSEGTIICQINFCSNGWLISSIENSYSDNKLKNPGEYKVAPKKDCIHICDL